MDEVGLALKAAYPRALATLTRLLGSLDAAEEAAQEAAARAASTWPERGVPDRPVAWLVRAGRNRHIDSFRRKGREAAYARSFAPIMEAARATPQIEDEVASAPYRDDLLRLMFTCCHPALPQDAQIALTLRAVGGLALEEIASACLTSAKTLEQRLTRAKRKIRDAGIPYEIPPADRMASRLDAVLSVVYLIFNEGYKATRGPDATRPDLAAEAIRLGRILSSLFRADCEVMGLLALMLLHHARLDARTDESGDLVPLDEQDRALWDRRLIAEGRAILDKSLRRKRPGPYQIEAAIAAVHGAAARAEDTDWREISVLYSQLERYRPSPVVTLNRAVALWKCSGPDAGLQVLRTIEAVPAMQAYHPFHAARAALLAELGDRPAARAAYERALLICRNGREQAFLRRKIAALN